MEEADADDAGGVDAWGAWQAARPTPTGSANVIAKSRHRARNIDLVDTEDGSLGNMSPYMSGPLRQEGA
ncbi:hypothetical protein FDG2_5681 [Candidatus Protofrankia californiensis]|uniref:Uncharacterized protein n=1 Tax=Candidatus Protofrankia californiensis TaxID=1839754 RepID=A0A1C3PEY3_9ACTN|nr:hypothetical protein FDG2_5681 [Candidatus Protofrankia californiensis]